MSGASLVARSPDRVEAESGEGKVTRLELFANGVADLEPEIRELIRAAA